MRMRDSTFNINTAAASYKLLVKTIIFHKSLYSKSLSVSVQLYVHSLHAN